jgi:hypothetical protein
VNHYLILFLVVLGINLLPAFAPPTDPAAHGMGDRCVVTAGRDDDYLLATAPRRIQISFDIGFHTATVRRVEGTGVDDAHARQFLIGRNDKPQR